MFDFTLSKMPCMCYTCFTRCRVFLLSDLNNKALVIFMTYTPVNLQACDTCVVGMYHMSHL